MKRLTALLVLGAVAVLPGTAHANAKVYRGTFEMVGPAGDYTSGGFGKAHLVDSRRDKLSVHVRSLAPRTKYVFRLQQAPKACEETAPAGTNVAGWKYRNGGVLKTNRKGGANGSARSHRFKAKRGVEYFVGVYELTADRKPGALVLCAELTTKKKHHGKRDKPSKHDKPRHDTKPRTDDKPAAPAPKSSDPQGKSDEAPRGNANGQKDDHPRGKSDEAPRGKAHGKDKDKKHKDKP